MSRCYLTRLSVFSSVLRAVFLHLPTRNNTPVPTARTHNEATRIEICTNTSTSHAVFNNNLYPRAIVICGLALTSLWTGEICVYASGNSNLINFQLEKIQIGNMLIDLGFQIQIHFKLLFWKEARKIQIRHGQQIHFPSSLLCSCRFFGDWLKFGQMLSKVKSVHDSFAVSFISQRVLVTLLRNDRSELV